MNLELLMLIILYIHQTMDIVGVKGYVDRPELISPDTIGWGLLTVLFGLYLFNVPYINYVFIILFGVVIIGLYYFHWRYFWFGASENKIKGYNEYFKGTHRILKESDVRLVPDTYHIVHSIIYVSTFLVLLFSSF